MNTSIRNLVAVGLALFAGISVCQAQVRGAGSKVLGNYDRFDQSRHYQVVAPRAAFPSQNAAVATAPATRAFSYEPTNKASAGAAAPLAAQKSAQQATTQRPVRRFSYDPGTVTAPRRSYVPMRGWQNGSRNAGSKVRGEY